MENGRVKGDVRLVVILCAGLLFLAASSITTNAWALCANYYYEALIDADNNSTTGGIVHVEQQGSSADIPGIDYIVRAVASITPTATKLIVGIQIWTWNGSAFFTSFTPAPIPFYNVGIGNGYQYDGSQADIVEFMASRAALGNPQGPMKIVYHASEQVGVSDYTGFFYDPPLSNVPTFSEWGMIILSLLLAIAALVVMRRRKSTANILLSSFLIVLSITGIVSANLTCPQIICLDGLSEDWIAIAATPAVTDPVGDSSVPDAWEDIVAGYITSDADNIYFRMDIVGGTDPVSCDF